MNEITRQSLLVSAAGGVIDYVTPDGELLLQVAVPAGRVAASDYLDLCPDGAIMQVSEGLYAVQPKTWVAVQESDKAFESGANPDFQPTDAARLERRLSMILADINEKSERIEKRAAALELVERIPRAPEPEPDPDPQVIDAEDGKP